jgi:anti-anti-sigma factor
MPAFYPPDGPDPALPLFELIDQLPDPCTLLDMAGVVRYANGAWRDVFFHTGLDEGLIATCAGLFTWPENTWAGLAGELQALLAGALPQVRFEAQIAEPPERWAVAVIAAAPGLGGFIWQLADVTRWQLAEDEALRVTRQFRDAMDSISDGFAIYDRDDRLVFCNQRYRQLYPLSGEMMLPGRSFEEIERTGALRGQYPEAAGRIEAWVAERVALHRALGTSESQLSDGRWLRATDQRTSEGGVVCIRTDITDEKRAEELRHQSALQDEVLRAQDALLAELSTPILRISEGAVVLPLVGSIDSTRAQRVAEALLGAVETQRADLVILDITGVPLVDTQVVNALLQCARAVRLLGARLVLTGIRPDVAQTIVALGIDLGDIITRADLREGIQYALKKR